ncbi:class I SAM-dependent methyltransferase [Laspinema sp. D1]|uniref:Class I SAM-dependent methyltransferase n=1 Tax=Laspinema palackyanum D2a TaxID=2953684 RepID=A0ABT2MUU2_9CYAN|nr:class I SAM-dependent methyltransferase [Laspinema sp. D2a]
MEDKRYSGSQYLENNPTWHTEHSSWKSLQIIKMLKKHNLNPTSIGEIGCGAGQVLNNLCQRLPDNVKFHGYEISPDAFSLCQDIINPRIQFHLKSVFEEASLLLVFDLILVIDVIEHIENYLEFLKLLQFKTPNSYKLFHIPLDMNVQNIWRNYPILQLRNTVGHLHYFSKDTALESLKDSGYNIVDYVYTAGSNDLPHSMKSRILKFPREIAFKINQDLAVRLLGGYSLLVLAK